jgi:hypothetical protein
MNRDVICQPLGADLRCEARHHSLTLATPDLSALFGFSCIYRMNLSPPASFGSRIAISSALPYEIRQNFKTILKESETK